MEVIPSELDPSIFRKERELEFSFALVHAAQSYVDAVATIEKHVAKNSPEAKQAQSKQVREMIERDDVLAGMSDRMLPLIEEVLLGRVERVSDVAAIDQVHATMQSSSEMVAALTFGYQSYMEANLTNVFGGDVDEAQTAAWVSAWGKVKETLQPAGGTTLAEVADMFEAMIAWRYPETFDPTDRLRGPEAAQDVAARTFYEVMEPHLNRAIMHRRDQWFGS